MSRSRKVSGWEDWGDWGDTDLHTPRRSPMHLLSGFGRSEGPPRRGSSHVLVKSSRPSAVKGGSVIGTGSLSVSHLFGERTRDADPRK